MPEPISSNGARLPSSYDPTVDNEGAVCRSDAPNSSQSQDPLTSANSEPSVQKLVSAVPAPSSALPTAPNAPAPSTAHNNAERTSERVGIAPYASTGQVADTFGIYAGAALLKGRDAKSGLDVEVLSLSNQIGTQNEAQIGLLRFGTSGPRGSVGVEAFTLRANSGIHNDDGSTGLNLGMQGTALSAELTCGTDNSGTFGLAAGAGGSGSIGLRDVDKDGKHEICAKASVGAVTLGLCIETPF